MRIRPDSRPRVVVTGLGVISPLGSGAKVFWDALCRGESGVRKITEFDAASAACRIAGTVPDFDATAQFDRRQRKSYERFALLGLAAAQQAWADARLDTIPRPEQTGVCMGTGIGGITSYSEAYHAIHAGPRERPINAYAIPRIMNSAVGAAVAMHFGLRGPNLTLNTACSSGANAVGLGLQWIRQGRVPVVLCGASEAPVTYELLKAWDALGVLVRTCNDVPENACRPFDQDRRGFVLSEGAAVLVLESLESAERRNATVYAEIAGYGNNCDAHNLTTPEESGITEAMTLALEDAGLAPDEIDAINAHGTGTRINDLVECRALHRVFGPRALHLPVSAPKSMLGHTMGASSALEAVASVLTLRHQCIPPTRNCENLDPECAIDPVADQARRQAVRTVLSNSFAFGGNNAVLAFRSWPN